MELEHLPKAPLKLAIAQVRFAPIFAIERREAVADFQAELGDCFVAQDLRTRSHAAPPPNEEAVWPFHDPKRDWTVLLSSTSLALEAVKYLDFDDFVGELAVLLKALHEVFSPKLEIRLGLRYVNRIEDERLTKRGLRFFVNEQLVAPVGKDLGNDLVSSLAELRFRERDGSLVLRHGLVESSEYLLDFDHFSAEEREFAPDAIVKRIKSYHALIERLFVWSLSERYLKELKRGTR